MTISIADVQNSIRQAVIDTGVLASPRAVCWEDEQQPTGKVICILRILYLQNMQDRECVTADDEVADQWNWALSSLYYIRVQIRTEAVYTAPAADALFALERIRASLHKPGLVLDSGVVLQHDNETYVHHLSFPHDGRIVSAYAFELGFRAVVDFPLTDPAEPAAPNMQEVVLFETAVEIGEDDPVSFDQTIVRP